MEDTLIHPRLYRRGFLRSPKGLAEEGKLDNAGLNRDHIQECHR